MVFPWFSMVFPVFQGFPCFSKIVQKNQKCSNMFHVFLFVPKFVPTKIYYFFELSLKKKLYWVKENKKYHGEYRFGGFLALDRTRGGG